MRSISDDCFLKPLISFQCAFDSLHVEIETERLFMRSYQDSDFDNCVHLYGNDAITGYFDHGKARTELEVRDLIREKGNKYFNQGKPFGLFSIFHKSSVNFIGQIDLLPISELGIAEIGFILHEQYHNQGFCTEAVSTIIFNYLEEINMNFDSEELPIMKIIATVHPKNQSSRKVLEKLGLKLDRIQERFGQPRLWYSLPLTLKGQKIGPPLTSTAAEHLWQAEDYHYHSSVQNDAAVQLLQQIQLKGYEQVLDVGCGDGKITAKLAKRLPNGSAIGIDASPEMIDFACKAFSKDYYPNLIFSVQDAQQFDYGAKLDLIFSSFALQWLPDPGLFFKCAYKSLKFAGYLAVTIPLGISAELEKTIKIISTSPRWSTYFQTFSPKWHFITDDEYKQLLEESNFISTQFTVVSQAVIFSSRENFENYVIQWFPYLNPLPQHLKQVFFKQVIDKYLEITSPIENGKVSFKFLRLDLIATKVNL
jgi:trans-aconitate 2-methyltransferase